MQREDINDLHRERRTGRPSPPSPERLALDEIWEKPEVFQPRRGDYEVHVGTLVRAVRANGGKPLDPVMIWWSGTHWYLLDGHHRLHAYHIYNQQHSDPVIKDIPVKVFGGTLLRAVARATAANSKDKRPMSQSEKSNAAWRIVCLEDGSLSKSEIARSAGISRPTVYAMIKCRDQLREPARDPKTEQFDPMELQWLDAKRMAKGEEVNEWTADDLQRRAEDIQKKLYEAFKDKLATNPVATAVALQMYSPELVKSLLETDPFQEAQEDLEAAREVHMDNLY